MPHAWMTMNSKLWGFERIDNIISTAVLKVGLD